ncbi:cytochrome P450 [Infundibulicybe gibba]|nr:cytochrome P450 [Infundibulicybe gibba]
MAMALYPDVQRKAQTEFDSVVGRELLRWHSVVPLGLAHASTCDDEYGGYFIPKGSMILGNVWGVLDIEIYDQLLEFRPERFLKNGEIDPERPGRGSSSVWVWPQICPGRHFSDNALFSLVSSVLSVFTISHAKDKHGNVIPIHAETTSGFLSYPVHFDCEIRPRSAAAEKLIRDSQELM